MEYAELLEKAGSLGGVEPLRAERAIEAVLETLGEALPDEEARVLAAELPAPASAWLLRRRVPGRFARSVLYDRVARRTGGSAGFAVEQTQAICELLAGIAPEAVVSVRPALEPEIAELLASRDRREAQPLRPIRMDADHPYAHTLATGRPGSRHPLSEGRPDRAHSQSVARSAEPHADTKLSSSAGLTQERLGESLASGRPGSRRPIGG
jgi:uncharacterized protein (DUF2267 family)